jgi:hypothetical protein
MGNALNSIFILLMIKHINASPALKCIRYNIFKFKYNRSTIHTCDSIFLINLDFFLKPTMAWFTMFNATFNNISVISWRSVLLVEEAGVPGENRRPVASH